MIKEQKLEMLNDELPRGVKLADCEETEINGNLAIILPGWYADDGDCEVRYLTETADEAASRYVRDGDWGEEVGKTEWVSVSAYRKALVIDDDGDVDAETIDEEQFSVPLEPEEPDCIDGEVHDWKSPIEIVGGCKQNPGVFGHGAGLIMVECCMNCGCKKTVDTWAQDPNSGAQGLTSVEYEPEFYAQEIEEAS